jgi:hypothetical protein
MDDPLRVIAEADGVFLRREALECGYDDKLIRSMVRERLWHRVRQGAYCFGDVWSTSTREQRHLILARAVLRTTPGPVVLSHTTALLAHGIAVWGADLTRVHVTRLDDGAGRNERDVIHHVGLVLDEDVVEIAGLPAVSPARAVVEAATVMTLESALVSADSALHRRRCHPDELRNVFGRMNHWPGSQRVHVVLHHMDGRSESPGETRARFMFWRHHVPVPDLQFEVYDDGGQLVAVTDFVWHDQRRFGEFDGVVKYGRTYLREGETPADVVVREKKREDLVRGITGYGCSRLMWPELSRPAETSARFRRELGL